MARYPSGELVGLGSTRRPRTNRGTRPESYDRGEPSGGLAGTALRVAGLRKLPKHVPAVSGRVQSMPLRASCITTLPSSEAPRLPLTSAY